jgi:hypothetical protein
MYIKRKKIKKIYSLETIIIVFNCFVVLLVKNNSIKFQTLFINSFMIMTKMIRKLLFYMLY